MHPFNTDILEYIALENPAGVDKLFIHRGYNPPAGHDERVAGLSQLLEVEHESIQGEIWALHPGRRKEKGHSESCFCGSCSGDLHYTGEKKEAVIQEAAPVQVEKAPESEKLQEQITSLRRQFMFALGGMVLFVILTTQLSRSA